MENIPVPILIVVGFFSLVCFFLGITTYYMNSLKKRGIRLSFSEICSFSIRKTLKPELLDALELADQHKFLVKPHYFEAHMIAGGNPYDLMKIIIEGKENGETISFREAATMEIGKTSLEAARELYEKHETKK